LGKLDPGGPERRGLTAVQAAGRGTSQEAKWRGHLHSRQVWASRHGRRPNRHQPVVGGHAWAAAVPASQLLPPQVTGHWAGFFQTSRRHRFRVQSGATYV